MPEQRAAQAKPSQPRRDVDDVVAAPPDRVSPRLNSQLTAAEERPADLERATRAMPEQRAAQAKPSQPRRDVDDGATAPRNRVNPRPTRQPPPAEQRPAKPGRGTRVMPEQSAAYGKRTRLRPNEDATVAEAHNRSSDAPDRHPTPGAQRPGGRTARNRTAVLEATLAELALRGYAELSFDAIAERAGVHKTTIYRRWRTRDQLIAAAFMDSAQRNLEVSDTADIDHDARTLARSVASTLAQPVVAAAARATLSLSSPEIRGEIARRFWGSREASVGPLIDRAVERGQLPPGTDAAALIAAIAAPLYFRLLVSDQPLTVAAADTAAAAALAAARAGVFNRSGATRVRRARGPESSRPR